MAYIIAYGSVLNPPRVIPHIDGQAEFCVTFDLKIDSEYECCDDDGESDTPMKFAVVACGRHATLCIDHMRVGAPILLRGDLLQTPSHLIELIPSPRVVTIDEISILRGELGVGRAHILNTLDEDHETQKEDKVPPRHLRAIGS